MSLTPLDHALALILLVIALDGKWQMRHVIRMINHGVPFARVRTYYEIMYMQWFLSIWLLMIWLTFDRGWIELGFSLGNWLSWIVGPVALLAVALFLYSQHRAILTLPDDKLQEVQQGLGDALIILPRTTLEHRWFIGTSITAGCCEELLYRGFLIWYVNHWCPPTVSLLLSCTAFGLAHYYQGLTGMLRTGIVGLLMGILYLTTETLLWPVLAHALIDLGAGWTSGALLRGEKQKE